MKLKDLKNNILSGQYDGGLIVFVCGDCRFLADQYIERLKSSKRLEENKITSLAETDGSALALVIDYGSYLNVLRTETFSEYSDDYSRFRNCIVVCDKIDAKLKDRLEKYAAELPKLTDWQVKEYVKAVCPGVDDAYADWLYKNAKGDVYRIANEADKIGIFPPERQEEIGAGIKSDAQSDLYALQLFDLSNAIINDDRRAVLDYLWHESVCDVDPFSLIGLLLSNFKKNLLVNGGSGLTPEEMGISPKQFAYLSRHSTLSDGFLVKAVKFLSEIDYRLKSGRLEMSQKELTDYVICGVMSLHRGQKGDA